MMKSTMMKWTSCPRKKPKLQQQFPPQNQQQQKNKERIVTFETNFTRGQGKPFQFDILSTHTIAHKNCKSRLMKKVTVLDNI